MLKNSYKLINFTTITSTNSYALKHLDHLSDRTVISAERQSAGRGQFKRSWFSTVPNNIYISIILKPKAIVPDAYLKKLTKMTAAAVVKTISEYIEPKYLSIKLPNDVLVEGKKIAGILTETKFRGGQCLGIVVGMGINLNLSEKVIARIDQPATALNLATGKKINKKRFLKEFLRVFFHQLE